MVVEEIWAKIHNHFFRVVVPPHLALAADIGTYVVRNLVWHPGSLIW